MIRNITYIISTLFLAVSVQASHIRAGEIIAKRLSGNTFEFTLTIYANSGSPIDDATAILNFGDGSSSGQITRTIDKLPVGNETVMNVYVTQHTYAGSGFFKVSYREEYRNAGILNMTAPDATAFYIETMVSINAQTGFNNPPVVQIPPIDVAKVGSVFVHNAGAYDPDGDSLSYKLTIPQQSAGLNVLGYSNPPASTSFSINPVTGDLVWDSPVPLASYPGIYNVAFVIEEWRKGVTGLWQRIGYITRDMQIRVENVPNRPPVLNTPKDTCIEAGTLLNATITATDPDLHFIALSSFSSIYQAPSPLPYATFTAPSNQPSPAAGAFSWQTSCLHVRQQPYAVVFRAEDRPVSDTLVDMQTWQIRVLGPRPTGLVLTPGSASMTLNWSAYSCANAEKMEIYRKSCDALGYTQEPCESGITGFTGYTKIGEVPIGTTTFTDNNSGKGLASGRSYCYILVAQFPRPGQGQSYASAESCSGLLLDAPILSEATVLSTGTPGSLRVSWLPPQSTSVLPPYTYRVFRAPGINGTNFALLGTLGALSFTDNTANTRDSAYTYKIELLGGATSSPSSSVYLRTVAGDREVNLSWTSQTAWTQDSVRICRSINGSAYQTVVTLAPYVTSYRDQNLQNCDTVCYYLDVYGSYCDPALAAGVLINASEQSCAIPQNQNPPNPPQLTLTGCNGDLSVYRNVLSWTNVADPQCPNVKQYNIYFAPYEDETLNFYTSVPGNVLTWQYIDSLSLAGCFAVKAVNFYNVESELSNKECIDNCVYYELPNLLTPNGDSLNDVMVPFPIPRGVREVEFEVYNRWGKRVFSTAPDLNIRWKGIGDNGLRLSDGIYYYSARIHYHRRLRKSDETEIRKGWLQLIDRPDQGWVE